MKVFNRLNAWLDRWLFNSFTVSGEGLAIYRICFAGYFLIFGVPTYTWISANPDSFFDPPLVSLAALFNGFPPYAVLQILSTLICVLFICLLFGFKTRATSILLTIALVVANSFKYSFGKIDHDIIYIATLFLMSFSGWGSHLSIDSITERSEGQSNMESWPIAFVAFIIAFGFLSAGIPKLLKWIDFDTTTHGVQAWVVRAFYVNNRQDLLVPYAVKIINPYFWEFLDVMAVMFELGFIVALSAPRRFRAYLCFAVLFHLINLLILNIPFNEHMLVYLLFINWEPDTSLLRQRRLFTQMQRFFNIRYMVVFTALYLSLYYAAQGIQSIPLTLSASPLRLMIENWTNVDYSMVTSIAIHLIATILVLWIAVPKVIKMLLRSRIFLRPA
jgi:uncharacterized membrane protein YphA (DoxX/SURF4 family)